jgi:hypothetical protein
LRVALGAADDGLDARDELVFVERLGHIIVGAEAQPADFIVDAGEAGKKENLRRNLLNK